MPPKRCPECGRFLSNELVASLAEASVPCPRCDTPLEADGLVGGARSSHRVQGGSEQGGGDRGGSGGGAVPSVRPPDLDPSEVRAPGDEVLAGWDVGVTRDEVDSWRADRRPFPTDVVVVAGAALLGGVLGAAVTDRRRPLGAAIGALGGGVTGGAVRRVWQLEG